MMKTLSLDPIAAVTHPDPYPYYAELVARRPLYRDEALGLWVASSARAVAAVLASELCQVRPLAEPVPAPLLGSPAGAIFRDLVRMNDGESHHPCKQIISSVLQELDAQAIQDEARQWAGELLARTRTSGRWQDFAFHLPVAVLASLLGVPREQIPQIVEWMSAFAPALAPGSIPTQTRSGIAAAGHLSAFFQELLARQRAERTASLLTRLAQAAAEADLLTQEVVVANAIGFMFQSYDATAGLVGNVLVTLATHPDIYEQVRINPRLWPLLLAEVLRYDPPVQNTRRFLAGSGYVAGQEMQAGDVVLVVVAAANRDPALNPRPAHFEPVRRPRNLFTFGEGLHVCPGATLASLIAQAGLEQLLAAGLQPAHLVTPFTYRPSVNTRIALLTAQRV